MLANQNALISQAGGKWFLDSKLLLLITPLVATTSVLTTAVLPHENNFDSAPVSEIYLQLLLANVFSLTTCAAIVIFLGKYVFRNRATKAVALPIVLLVSAALGAIKGATTGFFSWLLSIEPSLIDAISQRIWQTTLLGIWLIPSMALIGARLEFLQTQRDALVAERVRAELLGRKNRDESDNYKELYEFSAIARRELSAIQQSNNGAEQYAATIRKLVTDQLRPLSHRIWEQENTKLPGFSLLESLKAAVTSVGSVKGIVSLIYIVTSIPAIARYTTIEVAAFRAFAAAIVLYLGLSIFKLIRPKKVGWQIPWLTLCVLTIAVVIHLSAYFLISPIDELRPIETIFANFIWILQLTLFSSFLHGVRKSKEALSQELSQYIGAESIEKAARISQSRIINRDFANFLHGNVQNKLLSIALRLEQGPAAEFDAQAALTDVNQVLDSIKFDYMDSQSDSLEVALDKIFSQWSGFVVVQLNTDVEEPNLNSMQTSLIVQIVEEGISNSVRHGLAKQIEANIGTTQGKVFIEIVDDGLGPRNGKPGLGSALFKTSSSENWSLVGLPQGGSKLSVLIAL